MAEVSVSVRWIVPSATTFHVSTTGDDGNDGLSSSNPLKTLAKLRSVLFGGMVDFGGQTVTALIDSGSGNYTEQLLITPWNGGGDFIFDSGGKSISTTNASAIVISGGLPGDVTLINPNVAATGAYPGGIGIDHRGSGLVKFSGATFGACDVHLETETPSANLRATGNYSITGNATTAHVLLGPGEVQINSTQAPGITVTLIGTPAIGTFVFNSAGQAFMQGITFVGGATGARYAAQLNGIIFTGGGGANYFPGNAAGSTGSGGQYS